ncbi:MAG: thioester reductase domain-containing protein [Clostridiales bacterium]|nr:thioester reductase domain-containing protein [Clostridiales bacterium]
MAYIKTVTDYLRDQALAVPDHILYRFVDYNDEAQKWVLENHTVSETYYKSLEVAYMLRKKGVRPGERAVILSMQDHGTVCAVYGCMMAGVVFTVIPPPIDEDKTQRFISVIKSCKPKALISNYALEQGSDVNLTGRLLKEAFSDAVRLKRIYTDRLVPYRRDDVMLPADSESLVYLQYTSGSTSDPKGARVLWKNIMKNVEQCMNCYNFDHVSLATWVPFFHNLGLVVTICVSPLSTNSTGYFMNTMRFLEAPRLWLKLISDFRVTLTVGPGSAYDACTRIFSEKEAAELSLHQVTHFMNGSEFISAANVRRFYEMFDIAGNAMAPGYGVAENCCLATFAAQDYRTLTLDYEAYEKNQAVIVEGEPDEGQQIKEIVSVGRPVKDLTVLIADVDAQETYPELQMGEILLGGDSVVDGYWGDHPENKNFHVPMKGYDIGFYRTGDLGFMYEGNLYITGRIKEMIIVNGNNIYPSDLQATVEKGVPALAGHACGFFSCNIDEKEQVVAIVEARPSENFRLRVQEINKAVSERFAFSFYDVVFVPVDTIPRTDNRKLSVLKAKNKYLNRDLKILYSSRAAWHIHKKNDTIIGKTVDAADDILDKSVELVGDIADRTVDVADDIFVQVRSAFSKVLKTDRFSLNESFLALGGDSLSGFELVNAIEKKLHIKLDLREVLRDSSVNGITRYIHTLLGDIAASRKALNLADECRLDEDIRFEAEYDKPVTECRKILLTGATGFLGARLIRYIFRYYPHDGLKIYCLVRADSKEAGMKRIKDNLKHYRCYKSEMTPFIVPVCGDLSEPRLGLDDKDWKELSENVEIIYHNGAILNFVFPYEYLKETNVHGTVETIRLAGEGRAKYYHYVSSYSVYDTPGNHGRKVMEDDPLKNWHGFSLSYSETKWVSEKIVGIARKRGLKAAIYRPGDITGAANGVWELNDMISRMIVSTVQMQGVPFVGYRFHMTPVDYVGKALVYISRKEECFGHAFNLINPQDQPLPYIVKCIKACGYRVHYIPFRTWKNRIKKADTADNAMVLLECLFESGNDRNPNLISHVTGRNPIYDMTNTRLLLGLSGIKCSPIDRKMIGAYLEYFKAQGYI